MAQRILAATGELILAADTDVVNPTGLPHLSVFLPVIDGGAVAAGWQVNVTSTGLGNTIVVDHVGLIVVQIGPRGSKQFTAVEYPGFGWSHMDLPVTFPASRIVGGSSNGGVTLPILESDVTNLTTDLNAKAPTVHTHVAADVASGTLVPARLPVATTVAFGATEVDNNSSGTPVALTASGHGTAADPHPQYTLDTEKGALSGVATLDGAGKLTSSQLPLGTSASTAAAGNDTRLSDVRVPVAHATSHQNGGSDALNVGGLAGVLAAAQPPIIGATATTAVAGNDARLTDARTPASHVLATNAALGATETISGAAAGQVLRASSATAANFQALVEGDITNLTTDLAAKEVTANKGAVSGYASLDATTKVPIAQLPTGATSTTVCLGNDIRLPVILRLTADNSAIAAAAPTTALQVAGLTQAAQINDEWDIEWILEIANSIAADVFVFNVTSTAGTLTGRYTVTSSTGIPTAGAGVVKILMNPAGTLTTATANAPGATGTIGLVLTVVIRAQVKLTVSAGTIQCLLRAGTNAALTSGTAVVKAQSQMIASRIA